MNFGFLFLFLILQVVVNRVLILLLGDALSTAFGVLAYYLLSSLIISFMAAFFATPRAYRKDFLKQPAFHKMMLTYFLTFLVIDILFNMNVIIGLFS